MNASDYKVPTAELFSDKTVVVIGDSWTGHDFIKTMIMKVEFQKEFPFKSLNILGNGMIDLTISKDFQEYLESGQLNAIRGEGKQFDGFYEDGIILKDGTKFQCDTVFYAIGYEQKI